MPNTSPAAEADIGPPVPMPQLQEADATDEEHKIPSPLTSPADAVPDAAEIQMALEKVTEEAEDDVGELPAEEGGEVPAPPAVVAA